jgi:hypothetical protein
MTSGWNAEERRQLSRAILMTVRTHQIGVDDGLPQSELVCQMEAEEAVVVEILDSLSSHKPCPLVVDRDSDDPVYSLRRPGTVADFLNGLREDGTDPTDL